MSDDMIQPERPDPTDISRQPRRPDDRPPLDDRGDLPRLGSLAQTARNKHLKQARYTLLVVGILMVAIQAVMYFVELEQVKKFPGIDQDTAQQFLLIFHGGAIAVGLIFVFLSFFVEQYPVPITVVALAIFLVEQAVFIAIDWENAYRGLVIKIIVIVALVKALQAGIAAQKEGREAEYDREREQPY
jgi:hypothetical protein